MEEKDITYNTLLKRLRNTSPVLKEPEKLTQSIIERVETANSYQQKELKIRITGILSGIAASLLLCLLAHDTLQLPDSYGKQAIRQETAIQNISRDNPLKSNTLEELIQKKAASVHRKERLLLLSQKQ